MLAAMPTETLPGPQGVELQQEPNQVTQSTQPGPRRATESGSQQSREQAVEAGARTAPHLMGEAPRSARKETHARGREIWRNGIVGVVYPVITCNVYRPFSILLLLCC